LGRERGSDNVVDLDEGPGAACALRSDVPDELQRIVRKALSKNKEGRYQGIKDLLIDSGVETRA